MTSERLDLSEVVRTCIGCRERVTKTALVRVTAMWQETRWVVMPDDDVARPGRGAHLHPEARCLKLAIRRKAFRRALRIEGEVDPPALIALVGNEQTKD